MDLQLEFESTCSFLLSAYSDQEFMNFFLYNHYLNVIIIMPDAIKIKLNCMISPGNEKSRKINCIQDT